MMTHLRLWSKEWFDWKTAKSNFQIMVSKSTGRSNSVQQTRLATKTNQINFNEPLMFTVIFKRFSGKFVRPQLGNYQTKTLKGHLN